jgi:hypothetical protein
MPIPEIGEKGNIGLKTVYCQAIPDIFILRFIEAGLQSCSQLKSPSFPLCKRGKEGAHPVRVRKHVWIVPYRAAPQSGARRQRGICFLSPF